MTFLKFYFFDNIKLNIIQQLFNFKNDLRIEHQQKLKNFFKKIVIIIIATNVKNVIILKTIANEKIIISTISLLTKKKHEINSIIYQKKSKTILKLKTFVLNIKI